MEQTPKNDRCLDHTGEVIAWLAAFLAFALQLADAKAAADEVPKVCPTYNQLPAGVAGRQIDSVIGPHLLDRLGFDQRDVAGVLVIVMTVALESTSRMRHGDRDRTGWAAMHVRKKYRLDSSLALAHAFRAS